VINEVAQEFIRILLIETIIPLLVPVLVAVLVNLALSVRREAEARLTIRQRELLASAVATAVRAAEQAGLKGALENEAEKKLQYATEKTQELLNRYGLTGIDAEEIRLAIEAAIREGLHQRPGDNLVVVEGVLDTVKTDTEAA
jgi:triphosphoribosyl-dephospho-CoA synthetase